MATRAEAGHGGCAGPPLLRKARFAGAALAALALAGGCASVHSPGEVRATLDRTVEAARAHRAEGNEAEAYELVEAALDVAPEREDALALRTELPPGASSLYEHPGLGSNFAPRPPVDRSLPAEIALYLPDRILDLLDVLSFDVHGGPGLYANLHVTRAVQVGAGLRGVAGVGWHDHRSLGFLAQSESGLVLGPVGAQAYAGSVAGTSGVQTTAETLAGLHGPGDDIYRELRDYWAVGESLTLGIVGFDFDFHPVELADFVVGWGTLDLLNDDFAGTRGLRLEGEEQRLLELLGEYQRSDATMERFRESREEGRAAASGPEG